MYFKPKKKDHHIPNPWSLVVVVVVVVMVPHTKITILSKASGDHFSSIMFGVCVCVCLCMFCIEWMIFETRHDDHHQYEQIQIS